MLSGSTKGAWILAATILGSSLTFIDGTVVNVALPVLQEEFNTGVAGTQWIVESYALMLSALLLVGGSLGDHYGRKRIFALGVAVFAFSSAWCGLASSISHLIIARAIQGIGAALLVPGSLAIITAAFPEQKRGAAIGTWSGFTAIAAGFGPVLGGWLIANFSWRWAFFINVPFSVIVLLIVWRHVPESRDEQATGRLDYLGSFLATVGLGGTVFALIESGSKRLSNSLIITSAVVGVSAFALFIWVEGKSRSPMMPLRLFKSKTFAGANLLTLLLYSALGGILFFLPFNLIEVQGYSPTAAGSALLPFVLMMFLLSRWAGTLVKRYGARLPLIIGPAIAAIGFLLFSFPKAETGSYWTSFFPAILVMSFGMSVTVAPLTTVVMSAVERQEAGIASGINNAVSRTASLLAIAVLGIFMLAAFKTDFKKHLQALDLEPEIRAQLNAETNDLTALKLPGSFDVETKRSVKEAVNNSFVTGFRLIAWICSGLALLSAFAAWLLIEEKLGPG